MVGAEDGITDALFKFNAADFRELLLVPADARG
jgi:hypothetical protein